MKLSARNILQGKIKNIRRGPVSSPAVLVIAPGVERVSTITAERAAALKLEKGRGACAVIKASSAMIEVDE
jgi:molybdate transport system regulatory protein